MSRHAAVSLQPCPVQGPRRARELAQQQGYQHYVVLSWVQGIESSIPFAQRWAHVALGAQFRISEPWLLNFGVAYDYAFQDSASVSPALPVNATWRFGVGVDNQASKSFNWGVATEYAYGGTLDVNEQSTVPPAVGRGTLVGAHENTAILFLTAYFNGKFLDETPPRGR